MDGPIAEQTFTALVEDVGGCWRLEATAAAVVEVVVICSIGPVEEGFETITIGCLVLVWRIRWPPDRVLAVNPSFEVKMALAAEKSFGI